VVFDSLTK